MCGENVWLNSMDSSPVGEEPPHHEEKKATGIVTKKEASAPAVLNPSPLQVVSLDNSEQNASASAAVIQTSVPLAKSEHSASASASSTATPLQAISLQPTYPVNFAFLSSLAELDEINNKMDEATLRVSVEASSSAIPSESSASLATVSPASSSDRASGPSQEISKKAIDRARVEQVTTTLDANSREWGGIYFDVAKRAIRSADAKTLQDHMGPLMQYEHRLGEFLGDPYTYARMDLLVKKAVSSWLSCVKTHLIENKNIRYAADDFDSDILGHERDINISAFIEKIKREVEGRLSSIERNRRNQGALFLPPDIQARYVKYLVADYQAKLIAAHAELRVWLIRKGILDKTFTQNEVYDVGTFLQTELDKRSKEITDEDKKIKKRRATLEINQNRKKNNFRYAIDPSALASVTEVSSVSASVSSSFNSSSSCESTEEDDDEESKVESEVNHRRENSEKVKDSKEEKKRSQAESKEDTKAVPDTLLERLRLGEAEIKDFNGIRDAEGRTLIHYAIDAFIREPSQERLDIIEMLLQAGISPFVRDKNGEDAFEYADFDTRLQEQLVDRETRNRTALLYWKVLAFTGKYMVPLYSDYSQGVLDKINGYIQYAIRNLDSSVHWWTHDWYTSNVERPIQIGESLRAVHNGDINLSDPLLEQDASVVVVNANRENGPFFKSILGSIIEERLCRPQRLQVSVEEVSRSDKGAATLFYDTRYEQSEQARKVAEEKSRREEQARKEAEEKSRREEQARKEAEEKSKKAEEESKKTAAENEMLKRELEEYKKQHSQHVSPIMLAPRALSTSVESSNSAVVAPLPILIVANSGSVVSAHSVPSILSASVVLPLSMVPADSNSLVSASSVPFFKS